MKRSFLLFGTGLLLMGCATDPSKEANQTPQFGKPVSTIPWNEPTNWEKGGQLSSMPGYEPSR